MSRTLAVLTIAVALLAATVAAEASARSADTRLSLVVYSTPREA